MSNQNKTDYTSLALFMPSVVALAIVPIIMYATYVVTELEDVFRFHDGLEGNGNGRYYFVDVFSQGKAFAVVVIAIVMLAIALMCCAFLFKHSEKRSLVYVGSSVVFVLMSLISSLMSEYPEIAFYGEYDRAEGFFTTACYFVIFLFTMFTFKKTQNFRYVILALFFCVAANTVLGAYQFAGSNLLYQDWFSTLVVDRKYAVALELSDTLSNEKVYGALYHYNYVGSFAGMIVPLFTTLALFDKKIVNKIFYIAFDLMAIFLLLGSTARSGIVAVAAAALAGIIVFARVIAKHWKRCAAIVTAAVVLLVGANVVLDGRIFARIPSLVSDMTALFLPVGDNTDLFAELPIREIRHEDNGSVSFVTQDDKLNVRFDAEQKEYLFTDAAGTAVETDLIGSGDIVVLDDRFEELSFMFDNSDGNPEYDNLMFFWFGSNQQSSLLFQLFNGKVLHMIDHKTIERIEPVNAEHFGFEGKERLGSSRGYIWSRTIPLLKNCLVTGYGPDTFAYNFPQTDYLAKYYSYDEGFNITVDKPHNLYLQIFFSNGLIALIAFLVICVFYLVDSLRLYALRREYRAEQIYGVSVMLGIVGYLAAGLFNDSVVSVAPVFWILLGVGCALNTINRRMDKNLPVDEAEPQYKSRGVNKHEMEMAERAEEYAQDFAKALVEEKLRKTEENKPKQITYEDAESLLERIRKQREQAQQSAGPEAQEQESAEPEAQQESPDENE